MADNGNRGPNDSFRRSGRRRREPPIIDAAATEVAPEPTATDDAAGPAGSETAPVHPTQDARDGLPVGSEAPVSPGPAGDALPAAAAPEPAGHGLAAPEASDEPVLFGSAMRDPERRTEMQDDASPDAPPAETVAVSDAAREAEPLDHGPIAPGRDGEPPRFADPASRTGSPGPSGANALAGVLGIAAVILLGIIGWLVYSGGQRGNDLAGTVADLKARIATLEARPDATALQGQVASLDRKAAAAETDRAALGKQVAALSARIDAAGQTPGSSAAGATGPNAKPNEPAGQASAAPALATMAVVAALAAKVDGLDGRIAALAADQSGTARTVAALPKPVAPDFGPVDAKVAGLENQVNALDAKVNGSDARFNGFDARINGIEAKVNGFGTTMNAMTARMNGLESKVDDGAAQTATLKSDLANLPKVDLGPLRAATAALDGRLVKVESALAAPKDGTRVTEARAVGSADLTKATPIAVVGEAVERAIASSKPYGSEIAALKELGADPALVARLGPASAGGAPSVDALTSQWDAVRGSVLDTRKPIAPGAGGTLNRFLASASSIVQIHRVGVEPGADTNALVSQIDAALAQGDVAAALAAWDKLPDAGKAASKAWADAARGRVDATGAAADLVRGAITTLARSPD